MKAVGSTVRLTRSQLEVLVQDNLTWTVDRRPVKLGKPLTPDEVTSVNQLLGCGGERGEHRNEDGEKGVGQEGAP